MGCEKREPKNEKNKALYECAQCGKVEMREAKEGEEVKSCCGQPMKKK
jgi:hypothetical protein